MVTVISHHGRQTPSCIDDEDDENNHHHSQTRLDRLYWDSPQYPHHYRHQYPSNTFSLSDTRDTSMSANTVPVYRHGRKFYVSAEEFERMRIEERRNRRTLMQKSQNLPISKSNQASLRTTSISLHTPVHRSTSNPQGHRYGILKVPHLPTNSTLRNDDNACQSTRQSRSTFRYYDDQDDLSSAVSTLHKKLSTTTIRSNSSDKVLDRRRIPQASMLSYNDNAFSDNELKRSFSAELVQPTQHHIQQSQVSPRRISQLASSSNDMSTMPTFSVKSTDQIHNHSGTSRVANYFNQVQPSTLNFPMHKSSSYFPPTTNSFIYDHDVQDYDQIYSVHDSSNRHTRIDVPSVLIRSTPNNSNNEYYLRDVANGSLSDDCSSSPAMRSQRRNLDTNHCRRVQLAVENDDDYRQQGEMWTRSTARSQSSDGVTEKKRVRFADTEGLTLETVSDVEQNRLPMNDRLLANRSPALPSNHLRQERRSLRNSLYPMTTEVVYGGSNLATDV